MDQLVKRESQKLIEEQMREARIQRQIQVRQQAIAWTEARRRKFEEAKERGIRKLADAVTEQVQTTAIENIKLLTIQNDLVLAEMGSAHRAAAGMQQVDKLKSLKRLRNQELAKNRGSAAKSKLIKVREAESAKSLELLRRKEEVRKAEDNKSKELISRRPLTAISNSLTKRQDSKTLRPPKYHQSVAKTLRVAPDGVRPKTASSKTSKVKATPAEPPEPSDMNRRTVQKSSSIELLEQRRRESRKDKKGEDEKGVLSKAVRIKAHLEVEPSDNTHPASLSYGMGMRTYYMNAVKGMPQGYQATTTTTTTSTSLVRYYHAAIPKGEVTYVAPERLAVKEARSGSSPDAWELGKVKAVSSQEEQNKKLEKEQELKKRAEERGKMALKRAALEKQLLLVRTELLKTIDHELLGGSGGPEAFLGLADEKKKDGTGTTAGGEHGVDISSDEFSVIESDSEDYVFPQTSPTTLKRYTLTEEDRDREKNLVLVPITEGDEGSEETSSKKPADSQGVRPSTPEDSHSSYSSPRSARWSTDEFIEIPKDEKKQKVILDSSSEGKKKKKAAKTSDGHGPPAKTAGRDEADDSKRGKVAASKAPAQRKSAERSRLSDSLSNSSPSHHDSSNGSRRERETTNGSNGFGSTPASNGKTGSSSGSTLAEIHFRTTVAESIPEKDHSQSQSSSKGRAKQKKESGQKRSSTATSELSSTNDRKSSAKSDKTDRDRKSVPKSGGERYSSAESVGTLSSAGSHASDKGAGKKYKLEPLKQRHPDSDKSRRRSSGEAGTDKSVDSSKRTSGEKKKHHSPSKHKRSSGSSKGRPSSSSNSTVADIVIRTGSTDSVSVIQGRGISLEDLEARVKEQERRLRAGASPGLTTTTTTDTTSSSYEESRRERTGSRSSLERDMRRSAGAGQDITESSRSHTESSGDTPVQVTLKVRKSKERASPASGSEGVSTDYYNLPEGPYHSTPDGKLVQKRSSRLDTGSSDEKGKQALGNYIQDFLSRKPDSIENLQVSSSPSSVVRLDPDVLSTTDSFDRLGDSSVENRSGNSGHSKNSSSSHQSSPSSGNESMQVTYKNKKAPLSTLSEESGDQEQDSGSTIAETSIVTGVNPKVQVNNKSIVERSSNERTSSSDLSSYSSGKITEMLRALSSHQVKDKKQKEEGPPTSSDNNQGQQIPSSALLSTDRSSEDSLHGSASSQYLRGMLRRQKDRASRENISGSSGGEGESSTKSGPDKETKRVEFLDDITPVKLYDTPPRPNPNQNESEQLSAVFERLISRWAQFKIDPPPPWVAGSKQADEV